MPRKQSLGRYTKPASQYRKKAQREKEQDTVPEDEGVEPQAERVIGLSEKASNSTPRKTKSPATNSSSCKKYRDGMSPEKRMDSYERQNVRRRLAMASENEEQCNVRKLKRLQCDKTRKENSRNYHAGRHASDVLEVKQYVAFYDIGSLFDNHGQPKIQCKHCFAAKWPDEPANFCCDGGKVNLRAFRELPPFFRDMLQKESDMGKTFRKYIRNVNNASALASLDVEEVDPPGGGYKPSVVIKGMPRIRLGPLKAIDQPPAFAQLYVLDPDISDKEADLRMGCLYVGNRVSHKDKKLLKDIIAKTQGAIRKWNPYVEDFVSAMEYWEMYGSEQATLVIDASKRPDGQHERRYTQGFKEISVLMNDKNPVPSNKLVLIKRGGPEEMRFIRDTHRSSDPMRFILMFPSGDDGWHVSLRKDCNDETSERCTPKKFYCYHLQIRNEHRNPNPLGRPMENLAKGVDELRTGKGVNSISDPETINPKEKPDYVMDGHSDNDDNRHEPSVGPSPTIAKTPDMTGKYRYQTSPYNNVFRYGKLLQEYACIAEVKIENQDLTWMRFNQKTLRADRYNKVYDDMCASDATTDTSQLGVRMILGPSFLGGPRYMFQHYQDAMAICRQYGKPDFFITFTCNPNWPCIANDLLPGQTAADRPDLVARAFRIMQRSFLREIMDKQILGKAVAHINVTEFQQRGLPHNHLLIILDKAGRLKCATDVDDVVCAEIPPDPDCFPEGSKEYEAAKELLDLAKLITGFLTSSDTHYYRWEEDSYYPRYRRRDNRTVNFKGRVIDNRWVIPYNPYLLLRFKAHINVEACCSCGAVKYLHKYIHKGGDRAMAAAAMDKDEIKEFQDLRSVGSCEAFWRIHGSPLTSRKPAVQALRVHQENDQLVFFNDDNIEEIMEKGPRKTELDGFFEYNKENPDFRLTYVKFPEQLTWHSRDKQWKPRKAGETIGRINSVHPTRTEDFDLRMLLHNKHCEGKTSFKDLRTIGGVEYPTFRAVCSQLGLCAEDGEWELALEEAATEKSCGPTRALFVAILRYCQPENPRKLLEGHIDEWHDDFTYRYPEATIEQARIMAILDIERRLESFDKSLEDYGLEPLTSEQKIEVFELCQEEDERRFPAVFREELAFNLKDTIVFRNKQIAMLNGDQQEIFKTIMQMVMQGLVNEQRMGIQEADEVLSEIYALIPHPGSDSQDSSGSTQLSGTSFVAASNNSYHVSGPNLFATSNSSSILSGTSSLATSNNASNLPGTRIKGSCMFIDAIGGTGKTFLLNTVLATCRTLNNTKLVALAVAYSGIAASLLTQGRTFHSRFKVPILGGNQRASFNIKPKDTLAQAIRESIIIVWDEAPMANRDILEGLDRTLRDITKTKKPFGGKVIITAGDFRQVLPVIERASRAQIVDACLNRSPLFQHFQIRKLTKNLRVGDKPEYQEFASHLIDMGNGVLPVDKETNRIKLLPETVFVLDDTNRFTLEASLHDFIHLIFPNLMERGANVDTDYIYWVSERAILCPKNVEVDRVNDYIMSYFPGEPVQLESADIVQDEASAIEFPVEFLNTLTPSSLPPHILTLKVNSIVMLMRNFSPEEGLCNGTKLIVKKITPFCLHCKIASGLFIGNVVQLPRLNLKSESDTTRLPVTWYRRQFPVRPAFAMTINKSQGQTLKKAGVLLLDDCFSHGQLYVAASRVGSPKDIHFAIPSKAGPNTKNIVFQEVLLDSSPLNTYTPRPTKSTKRPAKPGLADMVKKRKRSTDSTIAKPETVMSKPILWSVNICTRPEAEIRATWNFSPDKYTAHMTSLNKFLGIDGTQYELQKPFSCAIDSILDLFHHTICQDIKSKILCENLGNNDDCTCDSCRQCSKLFKDLIAYSGSRDKIFTRSRLLPINDSMWDKVASTVPHDFVPKGRDNAGVQSFPQYLMDNVQPMDQVSNLLFGISISLLCPGCGAEEDLHLVPWDVVSMESRTRRPTLQGLIMQSLNDTTKSCTLSCGQEMEWTGKSSMGQFLFINPALSDEHKEGFAQEEIEICQTKYTFRGCIKNSSKHFKAIVKLSNKKIVVLDDLSNNASSFKDLRTCLYSLKADYGLMNGVCTMVYAKL